MHPAPSVILFSTLSGLGFGLLAWLGIGRPDVVGWAAFWMYFLGYGLAVGGLLASTFHLGNPRNARKAFSQWRTSWLSREAVLSVAALLLVAPFAFGRLFLGGGAPMLGIAGSIACLGTVFCTAMIYAQLKSVPRWNTPVTPVLFLGYAIAGGALLAGQTSAATVLLVGLGSAQIVGWNLADGGLIAKELTLEKATGLGDIGRVRQLEAPHTGANYLLKEMVYEVGRKHVSKLRIIGFGLAVFFPVLILILLPNNVLWTAIAACFHLAGVLATRWLFFAEAEHVMSLYYGKN